MDKVRTKIDKGQVSLRMDIQVYVDDFLQMLGEGESLKNALAKVILEESVSTWADRHNDYYVDSFDIEIDPENQSAKYESELILIEDE